MAAIHMILQGKGGVGKSLIAAIVAQKLIANGSDVRCFDTDPVNDTFSRYEAFTTSQVNILSADNVIDSRTFDELIEDLLNHEGDAVVDNGASTFIPLSAYLAENDSITMLEEAGKTVYIHTVLTGGQAMDDTLIGLNALATAHSAPIVVWENEFFGEVAKDGRRFTDSRSFAELQNRIKGVVTIHRRTADTFGKDMELMVKNKMTFDEAMKSPIFRTAAERNRLNTVRKSLFTQLAEIGI